MSAIRTRLLRHPGLVRLPIPQAPQTHHLIPSSFLPTSTTACRRYQTDAGTRTTDIPDYSHYLTNSPHNSARTFQYFVVGAFGALTAVAGKATVTDFLSTMSASADVLAMAKVEVDLSKIPEAKNLIIKYLSLPPFIPTLFCTLSLRLHPFVLFYTPLHSFALCIHCLHWRAVFIPLSLHYCVTHFCPEILLIPGGAENQSSSAIAHRTKSTRPTTSISPS